MDEEKEKRWLVERSDFFKEFNKEIIDGILPLMNRCHFKSDTAICLKDDDSDSLYLIIEGIVEVSVSSKDGKMITLGMMTKGDVFGEIGLLDHGSRTADVTSKSDVTLYRLSSRDFTAMTKKFGLKEWEAVTTYVCEMFRRVTNNLQEAAFLDTNVRLIKKILDIYNKSPESEKGTGSFKLNLSQEMLGRMVGLSREATNKTLSKLAEEGLIESKYKHIMVPKIESLRGLLEREEV